MSAFPASLVIVRTGAIGDVTNALVFAEAVRAQAPKTRIGWVVHPLAQPLLEGHPAVDQVHVWPRGGGFSGLRALGKELREASYDMAVDLQRILKSALVSRMSGAPRRVRYDRGRSKELSWLLGGEPIPAGDRSAHMVEQYLEFARHLGIESPTVRHRLPEDPAAEAWAEENFPGEAPVIFSIGASKPENRWPAERWGELAQVFARETGETGVLAGGPGDVELGRVAMDVSKRDARNYVGRTTLPQLIALLRKARLVVSADSGPMHLAVAVGTPVIALFGPADPRRTGPWNPGGDHLVLRSDTASNPSMADLDVPLILDATKRYIRDNL